MVLHGIIRSINGVIGTSGWYFGPYLQQLMFLRVVPPTFFRKTHPNPEDLAEQIDQSSRAFGHPDFRDAKNGIHDF